MLLYIHLHIYIYIYTYTGQGREMIQTRMISQSPGWRKQGSGSHKANGFPMSHGHTCLALNSNIEQLRRAVYVCPTCWWNIWLHLLCAVYHFIGKPVVLDMWELWAQWWACVAHLARRVTGLICESNESLVLFLHDLYKRCPPLLGQ